MREGFSKRQAGHAGRRRSWRKEKGRTSCLRAKGAECAVASGLGLQGDDHEDQEGEREDEATHGARGVEWFGW